MPARSDVGPMVIYIRQFEKTITEAKEQSSLSDFSDELQSAVKTLSRVTETLLKSMMVKDIDLVLSNSVKYLELFGNVVIAWIWLKQGIVAQAALAKEPHKEDKQFYQGKLQAMRYFFKSELPEINAWAKLLTDFDSTNFDMHPDWF